MTIQEQMAAQEQAWREFHRWEAGEPRQEREPERIISDLGAILDWIPAPSRLHDADPEKTGVHRMFDALSRLSRSR
jgi:hypothetical protein